jgi:hypothetical protein
MAIQTIKELRKSIGLTNGRTVNAYVHPKVSERLLNNEQRTIHQLEKSTRSRIYVFPDGNLHMEDVNITFVK